MGFPSEPRPGLLACAFFTLLVTAAWADADLPTSLDPRGLSLGAPTCKSGICLRTYDSTFHQEWGLVYTSAAEGRMQVMIDHCQFSWDGGANWTTKQLGGMDNIDKGKSHTMILFDDQKLRPKGAGAPAWRCEVAVKPAIGMRPAPPPNPMVSGMLHPPLRPAGAPSYAPDSGSSFNDTPSDGGRQASDDQLNKGLSDAERVIRQKQDDYNRQHATPTGKPATGSTVTCDPRVPC